MRLWSLHPKYLDSKGLVALWREALLAKHVLEGKTKGYKHHPQLDRFKNAENAIQLINQYLACVYEEAIARGYNFNREKINWQFDIVKISVTRGQIKYETEHLLSKLRKRDKIKFKTFHKLQRFKPHPLFKIVNGEVEDWEVVDK
jgi:pyrimidine dimer DNA glycosylase